MPKWAYIQCVPRAPTTSDVFNAIAEPRRRQIIDVLGHSGEMPVGELVLAVGLTQPAVSKHLSVLREVGVVAVERRGRERVYRLNGEGLKTVHDWVSVFERYWNNQLNRIKQRSESLARTSKGAPRNEKGTP